jgi:hypothetical protein
MKDFTLSMSKNPSGFIVTASSGEQVSLEFSVRPPLFAAESGRWLCQRIFTGPILTRYQEGVPDRLLLYLPVELLDWPWQMLHDGLQPLALCHPIVLLPAERLNTPAPAATGNFTRGKSLLQALKENRAPVTNWNRKMIFCSVQRRLFEPTTKNGM